MRSSVYKDSIKPVIVLVSICLVVTVAISIIYSITTPIIERNSMKSANQARMEVLPAGEGFSEYDGKLVEGVQDCYLADNGVGMAVTAGYKGFSGIVSVMVGIDADGAITGVKVTEHTETPGLGTKAAEPEYLKQYSGMSEVPAANIKENSDVDYISGATITSNAVYNSISIALAQFKECGGVK